MSTAKMPKWMEREVAKAERHTAEMESQGKLPAIPPNDYKGTQAAWMVGLMERGLWDGKKPEFHGDVWLTKEQYGELLHACERGDKVCDAAKGRIYLFVASALSREADLAAKVERLTFERDAWKVSNESGAWPRKVEEVVLQRDTATARLSEVEAELKLADEEIAILGARLRTEQAELRQLRNEWDELLESTCRRT